jgi:hypothetical protein
MAGKYKYIVFCDLAPEGRTLGEQGWQKFFKNEDELAKKHGVEVILRGTPCGVSESYVTIYSTDKPIDGLMKLINESERGKYVQAARTITVTPFVWG